MRYDVLLSQVMTPYATNSDRLLRNQCRTHPNQTERSRICGSNAKSSRRVADVTGPLHCGHTKTECIYESLGSGQVTDRLTAERHHHARKRFTSRAGHRSLCEIKGGSDRRSWGSRRRWPTRFSCRCRRPCRYSHGLPTRSCPTWHHVCR